MKLRSLVTTTCSFALLVAAGRSAPSTGSPFSGMPPTASRPWAVHDQNRPQPKRVEPGTPSTPEQPGQPPSDAIVLFNGTPASLANWEADTPQGEPSQPTKWVVVDGALECVPKSGFIRSKAKFGDCQLHVEWAAPAVAKGDSQGRGNSGIFLMGICEVQVLDSYNNPTYADGSANSVYAINPPAANALRPPGQFQSVDIVFRRPVYRDSKLVEAGHVTVFCNGVLVQDCTPVLAENYNQIGWRPYVYPETGPLKFQDHGNPVRFRNVWYRPLPPRPIDGGFDGDLTPEAASAKRREIAATLRADAAKLTGAAQMLRFAESLYYENDAATATQTEVLATAYVAGLKALGGAERDAKKGEAKSVQRAFQYLAKHGFVPATYAPKATLDQFATAQGWDDVKK